MIRPSKRVLWVQSHRTLVAQWINQFPPLFELSMCDLVGFHYQRFFKFASTAVATEISYYFFIILTGDLYRNSKLGLLIEWKLYQFKELSSCLNQKYVTWKKWERVGWSGDTRTVGPPGVRPGHPTKVPHSNALHFMKERDQFRIYLLTKTIFMYYFLILSIVILCSISLNALVLLSWAVTRSIVTQGMLYFRGLKICATFVYIFHLNFFVLKSRFTMVEWSYINFVAFKDVVNNELSRPKQERRLFFPFRSFSGRNTYLKSITLAK